MDPGVWDSRYGKEEFAYGKEPNVFVKEAAVKYLTKPSLVLDVASGEGRNAAYLASLGHTVHAIDFSEEGLKKTKLLAEALGVADRVVCVQADVTGTSWMPKRSDCEADAVVMSFCHLLAPDKPGVLANVAASLKPGGVLIMEVFHPDQVAKGYRAKSGGPPDPTMMYMLADLRNLLLASNGKELEGAETEYELAEGPLHTGLGAVTRMVWQKSEA